MFSSERDNEQTEAEYPPSIIESTGAAASVIPLVFSSSPEHLPPAPKVWGAPVSLMRTILPCPSGLSLTLPTTIVPSRLFFPSIRLGDIDLREPRLETPSQTLRYLRERSSTRRVYTARVEGRKGNVSVAIYEGKGEDEDWKEDTSYYSCMRHPNFVQLWGVTSTSRIHAAIFHDDLIPFCQFVNFYRDSPVLVAHIIAFCSSECRIRPSYDAIDLLIP
ncbi:hypothetical protein C8R47DRAFT_5829 [Mycena vitilis]|nr:hypothetical protein C8R47DRAFT_5829 [Mycena vitilis]